MPEAVTSSFCSRNDQSEPARDERVNRSRSQIRQDLKLPLDKAQILTGR